MTFDGPNFESANQKTDSNSEDSIQDFNPNTDFRQNLAMQEAQEAADDQYDIDEALNNLDAVNQANISTYLSETDADKLRAFISTEQDGIDLVTGKDRGVLYFKDLSFEQQKKLKDKLTTMVS